MTMMDRAYLSRLLFELNRPKGTANPWDVNTYYSTNPVATRSVTNGCRESADLVRNL